MFALKLNNLKIGRLKKRPDFLRIQKNGQKWISKGLIVEVSEAGEDKPRFGITVSKKVSKSAVTRNRIKRRLRSVAYEVFPNFHSSHIDIVLIGRKETETRGYQDLKNDLIWCLGKLGYKADKQLAE
ncbi:MAG: ribonuclease P protein component [Pseudomonadota bacterium]